jgi:hypothetical protein
MKVLTLSKLLAFLGQRSAAYRTLFNPNTPWGKAVLADLANFCRASASTWDDNPSKRDVLIGRREVWLRIQDHLRLTPEQLAEIFSVPTTPNQEE